MFLLRVDMLCVVFEHFACSFYSCAHCCLCLNQADYLLSRLNLLKDSIDDTEDLVNIELDQRQVVPTYSGLSCHACKLLPWC
jgi:hypothetical protein